MNFLLITFDFHPTVGGIQTRTKNYVENLTKTNNKVILVHLLNRRVMQTHFSDLIQDNKVCVEKYLGATVYRYPSRVKFLFHVFLEVIRTIRNTRIDVIHIGSGAYTPIAILFLFYAKIKGIKNGVSFYGKDILSSRHNLFDILRLKFVIFFADRIGVNSKATSTLIPKIVRKKITILYPGVDIRALKFFKDKTGTNKEEKNILFVGRLVWRKSVHEILKAFKLVLKEVPNSKLTIVGDGIQRKALIDLTRKLDIQSHVEFTGYLTGEKLWKKYKDCDVFVMPSKQTKLDMEGFGMVFLEAGLAKKPSIGTWCGGIPEAVIDGKTGILIPPGDIMALKKAIQLVLTNEDLANKLGQNAYNRVTSEFTWEKATLRLLGMYQ